MNITVAVCTYRRFDLLGDCLASLKMQSIDQSKYEILVIDNSLQPRESALFRESLRGFSNLKYIVTEQCGIAFARNEAMKRCQTEFLAFTDDDCITPRDWLETILLEFSLLDESVAVIGGRVLPNWETEQPDWLGKKLLHQFALINWGEERRPIYHSEGKWLLTANAAYRTNALRKAGGFPMHLGRKRELPLAQEEFAADQKLLELGFLMVYCPRLWVKHFIPHERATRRSLLRDAFWDGVSQVLLVTDGLDSNDTDVLSGKLIPLQDELLSKIDDSISGDILFDEANKFRGKGLHAARQYLVDKGKAKKYADSIWPVVYIVTPSFNAVDTIDQTITSVVSQAGDFSIRYHIQDGGSADGTLEKLEKWQNRLDNWSNAKSLIQCHNVVFTYRTESDNGMYDAISKGFAFMDIPLKATMTWINADDYLMPGAIATVQQAFSVSNDISWVTGAVHACTEKNYPFGHHCYAFPLPVIYNGLCDGYHWQHIQQEGTFWRKWLWDKVGGLDISLKYAGDWDLWRRFAHHCRPVQTNWALGCFKRHPGQLTEKHMDLYDAEIESRVSLAQRQKAFSHLAENPKDIWFHLLVPDSNKAYTVNNQVVDTHNIPGCVWQNCPDFAESLLGRSSSKHGHNVLETKRSAPPKAAAFEHMSSGDFNLIASFSRKSNWDLCPVPGQKNAFFGSGWQPQESDPSGWRRWSSGQGIMHIKAFKSQKARLTLTLASAIHKEDISVNLNGKEISCQSVGSEPQEFGPVALRLKAGTNIVSILSKQALKGLDNDSSSRRIMAKNITIDRSRPGFSGFKNIYYLFQATRLINRSGIFWTTFYLDQIPELKENNQFPVAHYLLYGAWENKNPNPLFDSSWYLSQYRDIYLAGENPLLHYIRCGWEEGRDPHPGFSTERYLRDHRDVREIGMNPLSHYLLHGILEDRKIHPSMKGGAF